MANPKEARRVLFSWLGEGELLSADLNSSELARAIKARKFHEVHLLANVDTTREVKKNGTNFGKVYTRPFFQKVKERLESMKVARVTIHECVLTSPTQFSEIFPFAQDTVRKVLEGQSGPVDLTYHLSSGTAPMIAVWVLIAKTRFKGDLIETRFPEDVRKKKETTFAVESVDVPFEISADFLPELIRTTDQALGARLISAPSFEEIKHRSPKTKEAIRLAQLAAQRDATVLLLGESGVGKELFASAIRDASPRKDNPLVVFNCGALPENLVESELFGFKKGAFTGADRDKAGRFKAADGGTIFLDEVGELPLATQTKLLRVLQEGEIQPVGATKAEKVNVRVIAATNRNLMAEVKEGRFREDLFYRLAVMVITIPPLREREEDILPIAEYVFAKLAGRFGMTKKHLSPDAKNLLKSHPWPGNVRELENVLTRAMLWSDHDRISGEDLRRSILAFPEQVRTSILDRPLDGSWRLEELLDDVSRQYLDRAMKHTRGNKTEAADLLGFKNYQTLTNWLKRLGMEDANRDI
ncbi:sigma 54-interacting transcriptional regulator [Candidatus Ozemobacteraceae bacterium]|nr:sigma 54-interacting transcriptional regulator [Candidatus Ozemobacteraceae bacterium]